MAEKQQEETMPPAKKQAYIPRLFSEAREDLSLTDIFIDLIVVIILTAIAIADHVAQKSESKELYYFAIGYFVFFLILAILVKVFVQTPYKIIKEQDIKLEEKATKDEKGRLLHDAIVKIQNRTRYLNGGKRYYEISGEDKRETLELIQGIYNSIYTDIGADAGGYFIGTKSTNKPLARFGLIASNTDPDWLAHLDYLDAHLESLKTIIEKQL